MTAVTISPKFQVVIPKEARERMHLKAGQKMQVLSYGRRLVFMPDESIQDLYGFLKGHDLKVEREEEDRV